MPTTPTKRAYDGLDAAYEYFNKRLFDGRLPACLITVRPHRGAYGYFSSERFGSRDDNEIHDENAIVRVLGRRSCYGATATSSVAVMCRCTGGRAMKCHDNVLKMR
jgi:hypothetical protein